ncbi:5376_t:CDS:2, partial [Scutellospora calospora]
MNKRKSPKYPELEKAIFSWVYELYSKLKLVTRAMIQIKAKTLSQKLPYITYYPGITKSKFVLDSFTTHITDIVKYRFSEKNTNLAVISEGLISKVQLLDVAINKSFKARDVKEDYLNFDYDQLRSQTNSCNHIYIYEESSNISEEGSSVNIQEGSSNNVEEGSSDNTEESSSNNMNEKNLN